MREKTYEMLVKNMNAFVSGGNISRLLDISRAAVLKHIKIFKDDGAIITSVNNKGHMLKNYADRLKEEYIKPLLDKGVKYNYVWKESVDSTNNLAKALAVAGSPHFTCVACEEQTFGRGRMGRTWVSPKYKGIYFSLILRPEIEAKDAPGITVAAAVAVCRVLKNMGLSAQIKWPNDVLVNGRKICGILTESSFNMDGMEYVVCGAGINANILKSGLGVELNDTATSVCIETGVEVQRTKLLADVLSAFAYYYGIFIREGVRALTCIYTEYSALHGKTITLITPKGEETGQFAGFDENAALLMKKDGKILRYIAGEISLRGV